MKTNKGREDSGKRAHKNKPVAKISPHDDVFHPAEEKLHDQLKHLSNGGFGV